MKNGSLKSTLTMTILWTIIYCLNENTFNSLFGLIQTSNLNITQLFQANSLRQFKYKCLDSSFKRRILQENELSFDAGFDGCGWEIGAIHFSCVAQTVNNLWVEVRRVANPTVKKVTKLISTTPTDQSIFVPAGNYISSIQTGYIFLDSSQFVSQLIVKIDNGKLFNIACGPVQIATVLTVLKNQRTDGFRLVLDKQGRFSSLDFHRHEIVNVDGSIINSQLKNTFNYLDYFQNQNVQLDRLEDNFYMRGPIGQNIGVYFLDEMYYNDWQVTAICIESNENYVQSIQLVLNHTLFRKSILTDIQGNSQRNPNNTKTLFIPTGQHVNWVYYYLDQTGSLTGFTISIYNGDMSECFGLCTEDISNKRVDKSKRSVYFSNKDNIFGLFGYSSENRITSLGFLLNIKLGTEGSSFVMESN